MIPRIPRTIILIIVCMSGVALYCQAMGLHTMDLLTKSVTADVSIKEHFQTLAGIREFPYQWRLLGSWLVAAGEHVTGLPTHTIDLGWKFVFLTASATCLFAFCRWYTSESGALCAVALYLVLTVAGFTDEQYHIYFTNDYVMLACWFGAVVLIRAELYVGAAALTGFGALAKETMLLVPVLLALRTLRSRRALPGFALAVAAFGIPTAVLRTVYRAPVREWAWFRMAYSNIPFLQTSMYEFKLTIRNNVKVALFYNVFWILAARRAVTIADPFMRDLAATGVIYLLLAYPVIYIREMRHFLVLAIVVLPLAINALEQRPGAAAPATPPTP